jgi:FkbM family methyltransferase
MFSQRTSSEVLYAKAIAGAYTYFFPTFPAHARTLVLKRDGLVGEGAASYERKWYIQEAEQGTPVLHFLGDGDVPSMTLKLDKDGIWRGHWLLGQKIPVELRPSKKQEGAQDLIDNEDDWVQKDEPIVLPYKKQGLIPYTGAPMLPYPCQLEPDKLLNESRTWAKAVSLTEDHVLCRVLTGILMYVHGKDTVVAPHLMFNGVWKPHVTSVLGKYMHPGWFCVDVGANQGYFSMILAHSAWRGGRLMAIEPNPELQRVLIRNITLGDFQRSTEIVECAVSDTKRMAALFVDKYALSNGTLRSFPADRLYDVPTDTLDNLIKAADWPRVDFIKISAQGSEPAVWEGMREVTLHENPGIVILMEWNPDNYENPKVFLDQILEDEFSLRYVTSGGDLAAIAAEDLLKAPACTLWLQR